MNEEVSCYIIATLRCLEALALQNLFFAAVLNLGNSIFSLIEIMVIYYGGSIIMVDT